MSGFLNDLNSTAFTLFGQGIKWSDMVGNLLGLGALALGWQRSMLTWPVQLLSGVVLFAAFSAGHLSGSAGKQLVVVVMAVWGWWQWQRGGGTRRAAGREAAGRGAAGRDAAGPVRISFATWPQRAGLVAAAGLGTVALALLFEHYTWMSWDPWPDAYIFVGTLVAMVAQAKGWVEFWFAWLAVDLVGVPLNFANGYAFSGYVYIVYFVLVVLGMRSWWQRSALPEGAAA